VRIETLCQRSSGQTAGALLEIDANRESNILCMDCRCVSFQLPRALAQSLGLPDLVTDVALSEQIRFVDANFWNRIEADVIEYGSPAQTLELRLTKWTIQEDNQVSTVDCPPRALCTEAPWADVDEVRNCVHIRVRGARDDRCCADIPALVQNDRSVGNSAMGPLPISLWGDIFAAIEMGIKAVDLLCG
jgi:hypothetical protein